MWLLSCLPYFKNSCKCLIVIDRSKRIKKECLLSDFCSLVKLNCYLLSEDTGPMWCCWGGKCLSDCTHATFRVAPGSSLSFKLTHNMVKQDIPIMKKDISKIYKFVAYQYVQNIWTDSVVLNIYPPPGACVSCMAPIKASVASVALNGSDSNHWSKICLTGAIKSCHAAGSSDPNVARLTPS